MAKKGRVSHVGGVNTQCDDGEIVFWSVDKQVYDYNKKTRWLRWRDRHRLDPLEIYIANNIESAIVYSHGHYMGMALMAMDCGRTKGMQEGLGNVP